MIALNDLTKARREGLRWNLLNTLNLCRPYTASEMQLLDVMRGIYMDASPLELRKELDYLLDRALLTIVKSPSGTWFADITRNGVDLVEYTVECDPGIARPPRYGI
jgi:hypothetical protein